MNVQSLFLLDGLQLSTADRLDSNIREAKTRIIFVVKYDMLTYIILPNLSSKFHPKFRMSSTSFIFIADQPNSEIQSPISIKQE